MARPTKKGLDYFGMEVDFNSKFKIFIAKYGNEGLGVWLRIVQNIYKDKGYYIDYNEDNLLVLSDELRIDYSFLEEIILFLVGRGIFDVDKFENYNILTSKRIQENYLEATSRRKNSEMELMYTLTTINDDKKYTNEMKLNEIKLNKIKINNDTCENPTTAQIDLCILHSLDYKNKSKNEVGKLIEDSIKNKKNNYQEPEFLKADVDEEVKIDLKGLIDGKYN